MKIYRELKTFQSKHKHTILPKHVTTNKPLREWLKVQRYQYKLFMGMSRGSRDDRFTEDHICLLEKIPNIIWQESWTVSLRKNVLKNF
mmetsp:Transcript_34462/g.46149  ORF Transcript_34462/g.46149 Transcript_34462/m.46149 type:complete len:88 (+) Transcript_34462:1276-1539(+)